VVLVDANVLLYGVNRNAPQHERAKRWIEETLSGSESVGFAWMVLLAFVRIATLPALHPHPLSCAQAFDVLDGWLEAGPATMVQPTSRHAGVLRGLLEESGSAGNLVSDAHLAALALEHGARLCTFDRDFARFPGLKAFAPA
jgi:uncharacterized protein